MRGQWVASSSSQGNQDSIHREKNCKSPDLALRRCLPSALPELCVCVCSCWKGLMVTWTRWAHSYISGKQFNLNQIWRADLEKHAPLVAVTCPQEVVSALVTVELRRQRLPTLLVLGRHPRADLVKMGTAWGHQTSETDNSGSVTILITLLPLEQPKGLVALSQVSL